MPRRARIKVESKTYHIMIRGINKQIIFEDFQDKTCYLEMLKKYKDQCGFELFAYCLMDNHIHLVIREHETKLDSIFRRINTAYAMHFNYKYMRSGQLFQDRFKSEPITNDIQLLQTIRYVHRNPIAAGSCNELIEYEFSSYAEYYGISLFDLCDKDCVFNIGGGIKSFLEFNDTASDFACMDLENTKSTRALMVSDKDALELVFNVLPSYRPGCFSDMNKNERKNCISLLKEKGLTNKQICRITGLGRGIVEKV